ncbi:MAG: HAMP domain-containing histidine kinase [Sulfuritalea sp.]|nr:HAMP domain-containing histidine kinase [Sulfuritalea sp.]
MDFITWFVPPNALSDPRAATRHKGIAKSLLAISLFASLMLVGDLFVRGSLPTVEYVLFAAGIAMPIVGALLIRATGDISLGLVTTNSAGILIVAVWAFFSGGITSVALPVMLANLALLSTFGDVAMLLIMGTTLAVAIVFLYLATAASWLPASFIPETATSALMLISMLGSAGLVILAGVVVARDRASVKANLRSTQLAAEQSSRAKTVFLASISNEFREPLITILSLAEKLRADKANPLHKEQLESIDHVSTAGRHLLGLLTQVLDMSRIEAGEFRVEEEPVRVNEILDPCLAIIELDAQDKGISLLNTSGALGESLIWADRALLKQVILNLLSNAVKFNHKEGSVSISCEKAGAAYLRVSVTDTGMGIASAKRNELFMPFARLGAETGSIRGAGLGLAIAKQLTEKMRGRIGCESTRGLGSTFWIELPLADHTGRAA